MKFALPLAVCLMVCSCILPAHGQLSFTVDPYTIDGERIKSGAVVAVADLNDDLLDDLVIFDSLGDVRIRYQLTEGFANHVYRDPPQDVGHAWCVVVADMNGDGICDMTIGSNDDILHWDGLGAIPRYDQRSQPLSEDMYTQGGNAVDMDNDGDLDLFVCNDIGRNFVGMNDGTGTFTQDMDLMDFSDIDGTSPAAGNYGSVWCDYDRDGDQDLYIARCLAGNPTPDTILSNQFFINQGDGTFERSFAYPDILSPHQSWTADFIDVENDGDWDLYILQRDRPAQLFLQEDDGTFVDVSAARGVDVSGKVIQIVSADYDADGFIDLLVTGDEVTHLLMNDGTGRFTDQTSSLPAQITFHTAVNGDFNHDGYLDLHVAYGFGYNQIGNQPNEIWYNEGNDHHFITIALQDDNKNRQGIGATIEVHSRLGIQMREVRAGESYGISRSHIQHFGLGDVTSVDSVVVYWPGGERQLFFGLQADSRYVLYRDGSILDRTDRVGIRAESYFICQGDTITLTSEEGIGQWSTGRFGRSYQASAPGLYAVTTSVQGKSITNFFDLLPAEDAVFDLQGPQNLCRVDAVELMAIDPYVRWSTGDTMQTIMVPTNQPISYSYRGSCAVESPEIVISSLDPTPPVVQNDTVIRGEEAILRSDQASTLWSVLPDGDILVVGDEFGLGPLQSDTVVYARTFDITSQEQIGLSLAAEQIGYHFTSVAADVYFETKSDVLLESVTVACRQAGARRIQLIDTADQMVYFDHVQDFTTGTNVINFNTFLPSGYTYVIRTDTAVNSSELGIVSPDFARVVGRPAAITGRLLDITGSSLDPANYYYYFDWQVLETSDDCLSDPVAVRGVVDRTSSIPEFIPSTELELYALGGQGRLAVEGLGDVDGRLSISDLQGRVLLRRELRSQSAMLIETDLSVGIYIARLIDATGRVATCKIWVQH